MKRFFTIIIFYLLINTLIFSGGVQESPESITIVPEPLSVSIPVEELDGTNPETISLQETYPDERIYNLLGPNTIQSGYPYSIFNVFEELAKTYDPIIIYWEFQPYSEEVTTRTSEAAVPAVAEVISQELIYYAKDHLDLSRTYDILETYDPAMANIIIMVECGKQRNRVTDKISIIFFNFNYRLITPSDQIVIGKSKASLIRESFYDPLNREIAEKTLADIWY